MWVARKMSATWLIRRRSVLPSLKSSTVKEKGTSDERTQSYGNDERNYVMPSRTRDSGETISRRVLWGKYQNNKIKTNDCGGGNKSFRWLDVLDVNDGVVGPDDKTTTRPDEWILETNKKNVPRRFARFGVRATGLDKT